MSLSSESNVNLGYRLDALHEALDRLETDPATESSARELVTLIRASSEFRNMEAIAQAAQQAETADTAAFPAKLRALIILMHQEVNRQNPNPGVLIVSRDAALATELKAGLESRGYPVVVTGKPAEAHEILATQIVGVCVVDLVLARADGRDFIADVRNRPATAAVTLVAIGPAVGRGGGGQEASSECDGFFHKPVKTADVANYLNFRLKRGPAKGREARRDPTTGTPNRAACYEAYSQIQKACANDEPISFALFGIHRFNTLVRNGGPVVRETLIRQVGSLLSASFRSSDVVARWGVSEFAVIMPGEDHYGATKAIEKVLPTLNRQTVTTPAGKQLPITLCAGLTLVNNQTPLEDAAATAECHLYMAFHHAWHSRRRHWLVSDAIPVSRRSESIALFLADAALARTIQQVLVRETFKVDVFSAREEALSAMSASPYNLLITDDGLASGDGFALVEQLRGLTDRKRLRTLMLVSDEAGIERASKAGVQDYAIKPASLSPLRSQVLRILWQREDSGSHSRMTVMVVDHEIPQLLIAGTALHQLGECRVLLAYGPQDALRRLMHVQPHFLIMDTAMPAMSAAEFLRSIPDLDWLKGMEIILACPASGPPPITKASHKILGEVTRPYRPVKFVNEIRSLIASLQDETLVMPPFTPAPLEAEVQRILALQTAAG